MKHGLFLVCAVVVISGVLVCQETPPAPGTGSEHQPVPPAGEQSTSPSASQPNPAGAQPGTSSASSQASSANDSARIAPGSVIPVQLTKTVDAKKAKKGDEVVAKVTQDLQATSGKVIVPKDTKVVGHVTEVQPRSKEQKESQLAIAFDRMEVKGGEQMQMPMSIQAIIAPPNRNASNDNNAAPNQPGGAPSAGGAAASGGYGGRGGMGGNTGAQSSQPNTQENTGNAPSEAQNQAGARPPITGETRGVVGISNLTLAATPGASQGSLVTSEKNNVKLEDGTFLLLRVSPGASPNAAAPQGPQAPQK